MITLGTSKFYTCTAIECGGVLSGSAFVARSREKQKPRMKSLARRVIRYEFIIGFNATVFEAAKRSQSRW